MLRPQFRRLWYAVSALKYVETAYLLYQACEAGEGIIGHRGIQIFCLSVICLSVCLSVCHQTPPSLWDRSLPKFIFGFFRPLRGSVKIWYWPQPNPPPANAPPKITSENENTYQACEAAGGIIGHRGIQIFCLSVVCGLSSVCRLSVCHQTPPSLWDRSLPKFIFGFFTPLRGSVKIWYWPQSNPPPPTTPQNDPPKWKFLIFDVLTWNFVHNLLTLAAS